MASVQKHRSPLFAVVGLALLAIPGFALGMFAGVAWERPSLLASHLLGRTADVPWDPVAVEEAPAAVPPQRAPLGDPSRRRLATQPIQPEALPDVAARAAPPPARPARPAARPTSASTSRKAPAPAPSGARFAVQVGAFSESQGAERLVARLRSSGFDAYVARGDAGARYRVRVGPLASREAAEKAARRLETEEKLPTWVLDENAV